MTVALEEGWAAKVGLAAGAAVQTPELEVVSVETVVGAPAWAWAWQEPPVAIPRRRE